MITFVLLLLTAHTFGCDLPSAPTYHSKYTFEVPLRTHSFENKYEPFGCHLWQT